MSSPALRRKRGREEEERHRRKSPPDGWDHWPSWFPTDEDLTMSSTSSSTSMLTPSLTPVATPTSTPTSTETWSGIQSTTPIPDHRPFYSDATTVVWPSSTEMADPNHGSAHPSNDPPDWDIDKGPGRKIITAAAATGAMMVLLAIGIIAFFCIRKRKRRRQQQISHAQMQMKSRGVPAMPAPTRTSIIYPQYAAPPSHAPPPALAPAQPIILGPIVPGSNGAYYTGIDTSDVVSVHDRMGQENPFADGYSLNDEPPPPYRPRSVAPMSRNASLRAPPTVTSRTSMIGGSGHAMRSPFADPIDDDDTISDISGPTLRGALDRMSVVSDLSYQEDPVVRRPNV